MTPEQEERANDEWWHACTPERKAQIRGWLDKGACGPEPHDDPAQTTIEELLSDPA